MATVSKKARSKPAAKAKTAKPAVKSSARPAAKKAAVPAKAKPAAKAAAPVEEPERSSAPMAEVDAEVLEFIAAIDTFKKQHGRPFPSWSEVLLIVRQLGYTRR